MTRKRRKIKPNGYWQNLDNVEEELQKIINHLGHFPTTQEIMAHNSTITSVMVKYHGGVTKVRELMGYGQLRKPNGYYHRKSNIKKELETIMAELDGEFPSERKLREKHSGLAAAIIRKHGGFNKVREWYGLEPLRQPDGHWEDFENVRTELNTIIAKLGHFPSKTELNEINSGLASGIYKYHGCLREIGKLYDHKPVQRPTGYWKKMKNIKEELEPVIDNLGHFPSYNELRGMNNGLLQGIQKYHGGLNKVRQKYVKGFNRRPGGYWQDQDNARREVDSLVQKLGRFPTPTEIFEMHSGLYHAINRYYKGVDNFRVKLGFAEEEMEVLKQVVKDAA